MRKPNDMRVNHVIKFMAGLFILASTLLGYYVSEYFLIFTAFVGINLMQYSITGLCPMAFILKKLGVKESNCPYC